MDALDDGHGLIARPSFAGLRVLAADDNAVNREVLREALASLGADVDFAEDGAEAVRMASDGAYGLILMDGSMPVMDGFEATRQIRADETASRRARTTIVALTAKVVGADQETWRAAGSDGYMTKPFTIDRLAQVLGDFQSGERAPAQPADQSACAVLLFDHDTLAQFDMLEATSGQDLKARIWAMFRGKAAAAFVELEEAVEAGTPGPDVSKLAHALKSMALSAGAARFANGCSAVETLAAANAAQDKVREALAQAGHALLETLEAMGGPAQRDKAA